MYIGYEMKVLYVPVVLLCVWLSLSVDTYTLLTSPVHLTPLIHHLAIYHCQGCVLYNASNNNASSHVARIFGNFLRRNNVYNLTLTRSLHMWHIGHLWGDMDWRVCQWRPPPTTLRALLWFLKDKNIPQCDIRTIIACMGGRGGHNIY